jgi:hypothetical protein
MFGYMFNFSVLSFLIKPLEIFLILVVLLLIGVVSFYSYILLSEKADADKGGIEKKPKPKDEPKPENKPGDGDKPPAPRPRPRPVGPLPGVS